MSFITSFVSIKDQKLSKDGKLIFNGSKERQLADVLLRAYEFLNPDYPKFYKMDQLSKLGFLACELLVGNRILKQEYQQEKIAVVLSNSSSSLDTDKKYFDTTSQIASPSLFVYTLPNIVAGEICIRHGLKGENVFFISEKFDSTFINGYVDHTFLQGAEACIAGWVETYGETHDVFLYLVEKEKRGLSIDHLPAHVSQLYQK